MDYRRLGTSGLKVSRLCLGTMMFGRWGNTDHDDCVRIVHRALDVVSPLAVPVLLEIGRESIYGEGHDALLAEAANDLIDEAMRLV